MLLIILAIGGGFAATALFILLALLNAQPERWSFCPECEEYHRGHYRQTHRPSVPYGMIGVEKCGDCEQWEAIRRDRASERRAA